MKKFLKILIYIVGTIIILGGFYNTAFAVAPNPLTATFVPNPLFSVSNFMPGDNKEANITINNNTETSQSAYIEAINISNGDNLANQMNLKIFDGEIEIYDGNFGTFLNTGPVLLSSINSLTSKNYNLRITFIESTDNDYQNKTLGFDICVGFSGGNQHCTGDTAVSEEEGSISSGGGSGSGGGSSGGSHRLVISSENASSILASDSVPDSGTATITWQTNIPATSQVIYGLASGAPYTLDLDVLPGLGYPLYNSENLTKTTNHLMLLTGLTLGETYVYRVVSRASPATVSYEHQFTVPISSENSNVITSGSLGIIENQGEILGANSKNLANVFSARWSGLFSWWWLWILLILLIVYFLWRFVFKNK